MRLSSYFLWLIKQHLFQNWTWIYSLRCFRYVRDSHNFFVLSCFSGFLVIKLRYTVYMVFHNFLLDLLYLVIKCRSCYCWSQQIIFCILPLENELNIQACPYAELFLTYMIKFGAGSVVLFQNFTIVVFARLLVWWRSFEKTAIRLNKMKLK